jgi:hypothetical protein
MSAVPTLASPVPLQAARPWLALAPLPAILLGAAAARAHGVAIGAFLPNVVALVLGGSGMLWLTHRWRNTSWWPLAAFVGIAATLIAPGIDGVHRWLSMRTLRINASATLLPWLMVGVVRSTARWRYATVALAVATAIIQVAQPDAAQASALALGLLPVLVGNAVIDRRRGLVIAALLLGLALAAWSRPDPLPALAHVEGILWLTASQGPVWTAAAIVAALALFIPALLASNHADGVTAQLGSGALLYLAAQFGATWVGNYPVPAFGAGAGPILGWYALTGAILLRQPDS